MATNERGNGFSKTMYWASVAGALALGLLVGWLWGFQSSPLQPEALAELAARGAASRAEPGTAAPRDGAPDTGLDTWMVALALAAKNQSLEEMIATLESQNLEPRDLVRGAIVEMGDDEIASAIAMVTAFDDEDLGEITDMKAFATRLADIALEGTLSDASEPSDSVTSVSFSDASPNDPDGFGAFESFPVGQGRIYAIFDTTRISERQVMLKWFRTDTPEILLFRRYNINPRDEYGWVWLDKGGSWKEGGYRVDVFTGDEAMQHLASGKFTIE